MGGDNTSKAGLTTLLAVVGAAVSVLTLYYARQDAKEKAAQNRPIVEFTARLVSSGLQKGMSSPPPVEFNFELTFLNTGTQIASEPTLHLNNLDAMFINVLDIALGDIGPSQNLKQPLRVIIRNRPFLGIVTLEGVVRYKDRVNTSREFNEPFCLEGNIRNALYDGDALDGTTYYDPAIEMHHCVGSPSKTPSRTPFK